MKILLALDGSSFSKTAAAFVAQLPLPDKTGLQLVSVVDSENLPPSSGSSSGALANLSSYLHDEAEKSLHGETTRFGDLGWKVTTAVLTGNPAAQILARASESEPDLIVVGSRGLSPFTGYMLGSVSHRILNHAECSTLVVRPGVPSPYADDKVKVLVGFDGSPQAQVALDSVAAIPFGSETQLTIATVVPLIQTYRMDIVQETSRWWQELWETARSELAEAAAGIGGESEVAQTLLKGEDVSGQLLGVLEQGGFDLVTLGSKGRGGWERFLLGSVSSKIAHHSPCSVLVIKGKGLAGCFSSEAKTG
jgi:nucleotide-binding universal stress UspA family protein